MCSREDAPPYDEPLEDSVDWAALRRRRHELEDERRRGIPPLEENQKQVVRDMAVEARGAWLAERRRRIEETGE